MVAIVVPFRGANGKQRLGPLADDERAALALAMLEDVLAACVGVGPAGRRHRGRARRRCARERGARRRRPGRRPGAAVAAALRTRGAVLVVNADLPVRAPRRPPRARGGHPRRPRVVARATARRTRSGSSRRTLFAPLYGAGQRRALPAPRARIGLDAVAAEIPNLADDVDSLADLDRLRAASARGRARGPPT